MRIISGKHKGRRIQAPKHLPVRPTTDMAKEALFNILHNRYYLDEISVLDLFTGIGSICLEFASRNTKQVTAVDKHAKCTVFVEKTAKSLSLDITVIKRDVYDFLANNKQNFDVIFADPPYHFEQKEFEKIHQLVIENKLLNKNGLLIIEHSSETKLDHLSHFEQEKKYGGNRFSFFSIEETN
jgi:16S rRNA (guanine(966)-N(2))-methyltransferase RsmD